MKPDEKGGRREGIAPAMVWAAAPALLLELAFYLAVGFAGVRRSFEKIQPAGLRALLLAGSGLAPYLLLSARLGNFRMPEFLLLAGLVGVLSFWYVAAKKGALADCVFLGVAAAVYLSRVFHEIFPSPAAHMQLEALGRLMWVHVGIGAVVGVRGWEAGLGFWPAGRDWRIGLEHYLFFLPAGGAAAYAMRAVKFHVAEPLWRAPLVAVGIFFAFLWGVALAEEFFFRGFLQQMLEKAWNSRVGALIAASVLFGLAHLPFRGFPNWKWVVLATLLGLSCGIAYWRAGSVRAPMVTHALVVATWKTLLGG